MGLEFVILTLSLVGADERQQGALAAGDRCFQTRDVLLDVVHAVLDLLALIGFSRLALDSAARQLPGSDSRCSVAPLQSFRARIRCATSRPSARHPEWALKPYRPACARGSLRSFQEDLDPPSPNFEHPRRQLVDEVAVVETSTTVPSYPAKASSRMSLARMSQVVVVRRAAGNWRGATGDAATHIAAFAAESTPMRLKDIVSLEQEASQETAQFGLRGSWREFGNVVEDARVRIELLVLVLGEVVGVDVWPGLYSPW